MPAVRQELRYRRSTAADGTAIVMATHNFEEAAAVGDCVAVLHRGRLTGYRKLNCVAPEELRFFYSQATEAGCEVYASESFVESLR